MAHVRQNWFAASESESAGAGCGRRGRGRRAEGMFVRVLVIVLALYSAVRIDREHGSQDGLLVRTPDSCSEGCEFESRQERRENFLLQS